MPMEWGEIIKGVHVGMAALSFSGFLLRYCWMLVESERLQSRLAYYLPAAIDTLLLVTGIWMAVHFGFSPIDDPWLGFKLLLIFVYIAFGMAALKRGPTKRIRAIAGIAAIMTFLWVAGVALTKNPLIFVG